MELELHACIFLCLMRAAITCRQCCTLLEQTSLPMSLGHCLMTVPLRGVLRASELLRHSQPRGCEAWGRWRWHPSDLGTYTLLHSLPLNCRSPFPAKQHGGPSVARGLDVYGGMLLAVCSLRSWELQGLLLRRFHQSKHGTSWLTPPTRSPLCGG